jgi:hypothetical protein
MDTKEYIRKLAIFLDANETKMSGDELADHLNRNNFQTSYGSKYEGKRGTYTLIRATFDWLTNDGQIGEANIVADVFVLPTGEKAY